jgi:transposase
LARYLFAVRKDIAEYMQRCELNDLLECDDDDNDPTLLRKKLKQLRKLEQKLIHRQNQLKIRKQDLKKEHQSNHKINLTEPDAPNMKHVNGKSTLPAYNAQVSVDKKTQLIVANDTVADRNDFEQFSPQHKSVEKNLGSDKTRQYDLDSGYHSMQQLEYIEKHKIDVLIAEPCPEKRSPKSKTKSVKEHLKNEQRLSRSDFIYCSEEDYYQCPTGQKLNFVGHGTIHNRKKRIYRSSCCKDCLLHRQCISSSNEHAIRTIIRDEHEIYAENMHKKLQTVEAKSRLKRRKCTVEPVFGNLKENLGFRRFRLRGLYKVKGEFNLMCIAHNINKLYKLINDINFNSDNFINKIKSIFVDSFNMFNARKLFLVN